MKVLGTENSDERYLDGMVFKKYAVDNQTSISMLLDEGHRRGIYIYEFNDGSFYVGKSIDAVSRYSQHGYSRQKEGTEGKFVNNVYFHEVTSPSAKVLDDAETKAIHAMDSKGFELTNVAKTHFPKGLKPVEIYVDDGSSFFLSWDRSEREIDMQYAPTKDSKSKINRFKKIEKHKNWPELRDLLNKYVFETVPAAGKTCGNLWTITGLPSTNKRVLPRIVALSVQNLETLVIMYDKSGELYGYLNVKDILPLLALPWYTTFSYANYKAADEVLAIDFFDLDELNDLLSRPNVLNAAYRLNVELMRKGGCMFRKYHNSSLANAIFEH